MTRWNNEINATFPHEGGRGWRGRVPSVFCVPRASVRLLCIHKRPRAITAGTLNTKLIVGTWFTASRTTCSTKLPPARETEDTCNVTRKRNRKNERILLRERSQVASESLTRNSRCIRISCRETAAGNQSQVYASKFYLLANISCPHTSFGGAARVIRNH